MRAVWGELGGAKAVLHFVNQKVPEHRQGGTKKSGNTSKFYSA